MKILLVNPPAPDTRQIWPPLGLLSVSATLKSAGHQTRIYDMLALKADMNALENEIQAFNPDIIGTGYTTPQCQSALKVLRTAKKLNKKTIIGGPHPTALPKESLADTGADAAYLWEVENTINKSIESVAAGKLSPDLPGLSYLDSGTLVQGPRVPVISDLDELPFLDYGEIPFHIYSQKQQTIRFPKQRPMATLVTSRGCPHKCSFCMNFMGKHWRYKSAERVLEEIDSLVQKHGVRELWILDDNFTWKKSRALQICEGIQKRNYKITMRFPNGLRADRIDEELVIELKKAGCYNIAFGIESGNQQMLNLLGKGEKLEQIRKAISIVNRHRLISTGFFVFGLPEETEATINDSIEFSISTGLSDVSFFTATPYPGTRLWDVCKDRVNKDWSTFDQDALQPISCSENISPKRLIELIQIANRRFYFRPKIFLHILRYLINPTAFGIFKNRLLSYLGLRSGNI